MRRLGYIIWNEHQVRSDVEKRGAWTYLRELLMKLRRRVARVESLVGKELALCKRRRVTHTLPARRDSRKILPILRLLLLDLSNFNRTVIGRLGPIGRRPKKYKIEILTYQNYHLCQ